MIVIVAAALLAAADPAPPQPVEDPAATLRAVQAMYDQSCQVRAYGSYDDLCDALRKQLREAAKASREAPKKKKPDPVVAAKPTESPPPAQPPATTVAAQ